MISQSESKKRIGEDCSSGAIVKRVRLKAPKPSLARQDFSERHAIGWKYAESLVSSGGRICLISLAKVAALPAHLSRTTFAKLPYSCLMQLWLHRDQLQGDSRFSSVVWSRLIDQEVFNESMKRTGVALRKKRIDPQEYLTQKSHTSTGSGPEATPAQPNHQAANGGTDDDDDLWKMPLLPMFPHPLGPVHPSFTIRELTIHEQQHVRGPRGPPPEVRAGMHLPFPASASAAGSPSVPGGLSRFRRNFAALAGGDAEAFSLEPKETVRRPPAFYRELVDQERALTACYQQARAAAAAAAAAAAITPPSPAAAAAVALRAGTSWSGRRSGGDGSLTGAHATVAAQVHTAYSLHGRTESNNTSPASALLPPLLLQSTPAAAETTAATASSVVVTQAPNGAAAAAVVSASAAATQLVVAPGDESGCPHRTDVLFPPGARDHDGEPVDMRQVTSWNSELQHVSLPEMLEVQLVNVTAPFTIVSQLLPLLQRRRRCPEEEGDAEVEEGMEESAGVGGGAWEVNRQRRFVINVTSPEGQFNTAYAKRSVHPHTNMAKAALNMFTRTIAAQLLPHSVSILSVDPGWVSDLRPAVDHGTLPQGWWTAAQPAPPPRPLFCGPWVAEAATSRTANSTEARRRRRQYRPPPLTAEDGAARVLHPIYAFGAATDPLPPTGVLLRDFRVQPW